MPPARNIQVKDNKVFLLANTGEWYYYDLSEKPLGGGAMGTVYFGRSYRDPHFMVAIKRVADRIADIPAVRQRAKTEATLAFRHRNLIEMMGYCEQYPDQGPIFIISKLVQGVPLDTFVEEFRNSPNWVDKICRCILPVTDALTYLHGKGIIHMDIKPSNIMVENSSNIRLMDLGIAYTASIASSGNGGLLGTAGFAAPEQYISKGSTDITFQPATDIYQLGATLYDLLAGEKPYSGDGEVLKPIQGVPKPVMRAISKALQKAPEDRYQTAAAFKQALVQALAQKQSGGAKWGLVLGIAGGALLLLIIILLISL